MFQKIIILITSAFLLTGCADSFKGYFKKSANNKWIDTKGFHGGKRKPLYNKKYINLAKRNILEENYDDGDEELYLDDAYESRSPIRENREMYQNMLKADAKRRQRQRAEQPTRRLSDYEVEDYPSLNRANDRINKTKYDNNQDLQKELAEIKAMLSEAKNDLTKYKCPIEGPKTTPASHPKPSVKNSTDKSKTLPKRDEANLKEQSLAEDDDYKQVNSNIHSQENSDYHPI